MRRWDGDATVTMAKAMRRRDGEAGEAGARRDGDDGDGDDGDDATTIRRRRQLTRSDVCMYAHTACQCSGGRWRGGRWCGGLERLRSCRGMQLT